MDTLQKIIDCLKKDGIDIIGIHKIVKQQQRYRLLQRSYIKKRYDTFNSFKSVE